jgi:hypothetical protein
MVGLMEFLQDAVSDDDFAFLDEDRRMAAGRAVDRGGYTWYGKWGESVARAYLK